MTQEPLTEVRDVIIVGSGPAGYTAYLAALHEAVGSQAPQDALV
ncbi:hypothetical protein [Georgenia yuyongxinii]|nr:hypothetical protein [Georgenia yuyongxinii]